MRSDACVNLVNDGVEKCHAAGGGGGFGANDSSEAPHEARAVVPLKSHGMYDSNSGSLAGGAPSSSSFSNSPRTLAHRDTSDSLWSYSMLLISEQVNGSQITGLATRSKTPHEVMGQHFVIFWASVRARGPFL